MIVLVIIYKIGRSHDCLVIDLENYGKPCLYLYLNKGKSGGIWYLGAPPIGTRQQNLT